MAADRGSFGQGIAIGFGFAMAVMLVLVTSTGDWKNVYADMGHAEIPLMTRITISTAWRIGMPGGGVLALVALIIRRPRGNALYAAVAIALGVALPVTWYFQSAPLFALAGNIKG